VEADFPNAQHRKRFIRTKGGYGVIGSEGEPAAKKQSESRLEEEEDAKTRESLALAKLAGRKEREGKFSSFAARMPPSCPKLRRCLVPRSLEAITSARASTTMNALSYSAK
jgi:hypothetical protein